MKRYNKQKPHFVQGIILTTTINSAPNSVRAGESAFKARIPFYNNPYKENPGKSGWIRGFKRAEREFFEAQKRSQKILEAVGFEEVEA